MENKIPKFVQEEIDYIIEKANFTNEEKTLFLLRNKKYSLEQCAEMMDFSVSTINRRMKDIYKKMHKVIKDF